MSLLSDWSDESCPIARGLDVLGDASMRLEGLDPPVVRNDQVKAAWCSPGRHRSSTELGTTSARFETVPTDVADPRSMRYQSRDFHAL